MYNLFIYLRLFIYVFIYLYYEVVKCLTHQDIYGNVITKKCGYHYQREFPIFPVLITQRKY
jgi:hypothetical protein